MTSRIEEAVTEDHWCPDIIPKADVIYMNLSSTLRMLPYSIFYCLRDQRLLTHPSQ